MAMCQASKMALSSVLTLLSLVAQAVADDPKPTTTTAPASKPTDKPADKDKAARRRHGPAPLFVLLIILAFFALIGVGVWILGTHLRARRLGLPPPTFASYFSRGGGSGAAARGYPSGGGSASKPGVVGWVTGKINGLRGGRERTAGGAYEQPLGGFGGAGGRQGARGGAGLDPDEAWDTRVGAEADAYGGGVGGYYEEQELGLHGPGPYSAGGYEEATGATVLPGYGEEAPRGRSRSRDPQRLDERYEEEMGTGAKKAANLFDDHAEPSDMSLRGVSPRPIEGEGKDGQRRSQFREDNMK